MHVIDQMPVQIAHFKIAVMESVSTVHTDSRCSSRDKISRSKWQFFFANCQELGNLAHPDFGTRVLGRRHFRDTRSNKHSTMKMSNLK